MTGNSLSEIKGIALYYTGSNNLMSSNNFQNNYEGILFTGSPESSINNTIYGNNFNHNSENAVVPYIRDQPLNFWDNGTVGNYWSDYTGADNSGDGIGDTPYEIAVNNIDNYPLMTQISLIPEFQWWITMPPLVGALLLTRFITRKKTSSKKRTLLATLLLMPLILVSLGFSINLVHGNFVVPPIPPLTITIQLPENNGVYTENSIPVAFAVQRTYERVYMLEKPDSYTYTLDGKEGLFTPS